jgi:hypothetical protein
MRSLPIDALFADSEPAEPLQLGQRGINGSAPPASDPHEFEPVPLALRVLEEHLHDIGHLGRQFEIVKVGFHLGPSAAD